MEKLLNKLIEKGWRPRGYNDIKKITVENNKNVKQKVIHLRPEIGVDTETLTRFICVKESGLWQFVCENKLAISYKGRPLKKKHPEWHKFEDSNGEEVPFSSTCDFLTEYRLIESALCDEDKLEEFLLENIKVE